MAQKQINLIEQKNLFYKQPHKQFNALKIKILLLEEIINSTHAPLSYLDQDFNFMIINWPFIEASGYTKDQLLGKNHFKLFPNAENQALFEQAKKSGTPIEYHSKPFEYFNQPERGTTYWDWKLTPIKIQNQVLGFVLSLFDVTELVKSKFELTEALSNLINMNQELILTNRKAEQNLVKLEAVFDAMLDAVMIYDATGKIIKTNLYAMETLGLDPTGMHRDEIHQQIPLYYFDGRMVKKHELPGLRALKGELIQGENYQYYTQNKELKTILCNAVPLKLSGEIIGAVTSWRDITDREAFLEELLSEQQNLANILHQLPSGIIIAEAPTGKILMSNFRIAQIWRGPLQKVEQISEYSVFKAYYQDGQPYSPEECPLARSITTGEVIFNEEIKIIREDGTTGIICCCSSPIRNAKQKIIAGVMNIMEI